MASAHTFQEDVRRYLLGELQTHRQEAFEKQLMVDGELFEELLVTEDELIDEYLAGRLNKPEQERFASYFLTTPERHEKLRFASALNLYIAANRKAHTEAAPAFAQLAIWQRPTIRAIAVVSCLALATVAIWLILHNRRTTPQTFATVTVTISQGTRGQAPESVKVTIPANTEALKIELRLPEGQPKASRYRAELESETQEERVLGTAAPQGDSVEVVIPATELKRGEYAIKLYTITDSGASRRVNGSYFFTVE